MTTRLRGLLAIWAFIAIATPAAIGTGQEIVCPRAADDWGYCISRPGLRQEGQAVPEVGGLHFQREPVPHRLEEEGVRLTTPIGTFRYGEREDPLSSGGWWLDSEMTTHEREVEAAEAMAPTVTPDELEAGFYQASFADKKYGTPPDWVFVEADGAAEALYWTSAHLTYWADPTKLDRLPLE